MKKTSIQLIFSLLMILPIFTFNNKSHAQDLYSFTKEYWERQEAYENQLPYEIELKLNLVKDKNHNSSIYEHITINDTNQILEIINILKNCQCEANGTSNNIIGNVLIIDCHYDELFSNKYNKTIYDISLVYEIILSTSGNCTTVPEGIHGKLNIADIDNSINNLAKYFTNDGINNNLIYDPIESTTNIDDATITNPNVLENNNATSIISEQIPAQTKDNENASQRNDNSIQSDDKIDNETNYKESITNEATIYNKNIINYIIIFIILFLIIVLYKLINKIKK